MAGDYTKAEKDNLQDVIKCQKILKIAGDYVVSGD
jgi:hypothetical protein